MTYQEHLLAVARSQIGVREIGHSNTGPMIDRYLRSVDLPPGAPWCAAFVYWCMVKVCAGMEGVCPATGVEPPIPKTGSTSAVYRWARANGRLVTGRPDPGDLFLVPGGPTGYRHIGFVETVLLRTVRTIEGNTNKAGSSEGVAVLRRTRWRKSLVFVSTSTEGGN